MTRPILVFVAAALASACASSGAPAPAGASAAARRPAAGPEAEYVAILSRPLIPPIVFFTDFILIIFGIEVVTSGSNISLLSHTGEWVYLVITENCAGVWSLGTFTIAALIVIASFPQAISKRGIFYIILGYIGTYMINIARVVFIALVGYHYGAYGAIKSAHDYIRVVFFSIWMIVFWYLFITRFLRLSVMPRKKRNDP